MKKQPQHNDVRPRKQFFTAEDSLWQQETPADFFTALYIFMTTPKESVYRVSKKDPAKTGWKLRKDSISPNWVFDPALNADLKSLPAVYNYIEQHVPKNGGCHIVAFADAAIVLYIQEEGHIAAMLASANSF